MLKKYSDDIRAAHSDLIAISPMTLSEDMATIERTYCDKLIAELEAKCDKATVPSPDKAFAELETKRDKATVPGPDPDEVFRVATLKGLKNGIKYGGFPTLTQLKEADAKDNTIIDEVIDYENKRKYSARGYLASAIYKFYKYENWSCYSIANMELIVWLIQRGFSLDPLNIGEFVRTNKASSEITLQVFNALHKRGFYFPPDLPLILAELGRFDLVQWLYNNVLRDWGKVDDVLMVAIKAKNMEMVKYLCALNLK